MAMTIVEAGRTVIGGVDTHLDVHVAAALDPIGGVLGVESFVATPRGYKAMLEWMGGFGTLSKVGVEGTGAYGAGLGRFLRRAGIEVIEVDRPNRQVRRTKGKSDPADAVEAAVLSERPMHRRTQVRDGNVEAIRALLVAKRSAREGRLRAVHQMRQLELHRPRPAPMPVEGLSTHRVHRRERPPCGPGRATLSSMPPRRRSPASVAGSGPRRRDRPRRAACRARDGDRPELLELFGVGIDTAAVLLVTAGDNPERLRSEAAWAHLCGVAPIEASSGKVTRHRLDRGGDRNANQALWRIVMTRLSSTPAPASTWSAGRRKAAPSVRSSGS